MDRYTGEVEARTTGIREDNLAGLPWSSQQHHEGSKTMAVALIMTIQSTKEQYDTVIRRLEEAGAGAPPGRLYHVAGQGENAWRVVDVWDSPESFERFAQTLIPITQQAGIPPFQPEVVPVHNIIPGGVAV
jgi:hypothetical protein